MDKKDIKIGTIVKYKRASNLHNTNFIGYIYKIDKESATYVKVEWSISLCEWEKSEDLEKIEIDSPEHFAEGLLKAIKGI